MFDFNVIFATFFIGIINTANVLMESKVNRKQKTNERESQGINSWVMASGGGGSLVVPVSKIQNIKYRVSLKKGTLAIVGLFLF